MHKTTIDLTITSGISLERGLNLTIICNDEIVWKKNNIVQDITKISIECSLPLIMELQISGKNENDTLTDDQSNIIHDKFLLVSHMAIDDVWVKTWVLEKKIFQSDFGNSNYFGHNGSYYVKIPSTDMLDFWLDTMID